MFEFFAKKLIPSFLVGHASILLAQYTDKAHGASEDSAEEMPGRNNSFSLSSLESIKTGD